MRRLPIRPNLRRTLGITILLSLLLLVASPILGQEAAQEVTLERIMSHQEWLGREPQRPYWNWDSRSVLFFRAHATVDGVDPRINELYQQSLNESRARLLDPAELRDVDPARSVVDTDQRNRAYERNGDLFVRSLETGVARQLTKTSDRESRPFFLADGRLGYQRGRNAIYARDLITGLEEQLFAGASTDDPEAAEAKKRAGRDYIAREEERLVGWVSADAERQRLHAERDQAIALGSERADQPWHLGAKTEIQGMSASPNGRLALVTLANKSPDRSGTKMPTYISSSADIEVRDVRSKVGTSPQAGQRLVVLDRVSGQQLVLDLDELPTRREDPLAELRKAAKEREKARKESADPKDADSGEAVSEGKTKDDGQEASKEATEAVPATQAKKTSSKPAKPKPRDIQFSQPQWSDDGTFAVVQARSNDNKDRWIIQLDWSELLADTSQPDTRSEDAALLEDAAKPEVSKPKDTKPEPKVRVIHHQHDPAWINWSFRDLGLLPGSNQIFFLSEASGYSHLYIAAKKGDKAARQLTHGDFVVDSPQASADGSFIYFTSSELHPGRTEVYRVELASREIQQMTDLGGQNSYTLSPNAAQLLIQHSTTTVPPELFVQEVTPGGAPRQFTHTVSDEFRRYDWVEPQIVKVPSSYHDRSIYSRLYLPQTEPIGPADAQAGSGRPAVVFVHGAGYLQNSHFGWSGYFREFMFHTLLTQHGYVVLDMDYRASKGYGRDWRTAIYRQMGWPEVEDLEDGVDYLVSNHGVDRDRIGVYGGSYGGFLAFMSLFNKPDLFAAGAALRPVTDWAHYNHGYTSNILNTPELDPEAYQKSSPIEFAEGLTKPLLIATGMLDNNVFFQDSVRLVQKLIELGKEDWEIAIYPIEPHGFREPSSWLDEYRRIFKLFEREVRGVD